MGSEDAVSATRALLERLGSRESVGYGPRAIPDPLDRAARRFVEIFEVAEVETRAHIASTMTTAQRDALSAFGQRMATQAVRDGDAGVLAMGLLAAGVGWCFEDWRDSAVSLPIFYDAAKRLGIDAVALFDGAAAVAGEPAAEHLLSFPRREPRDRSLSAMGWRAGSDADGFRYVMSG